MHEPEHAREREMRETAKKDWRSPQLTVLDIKTTTQNGSVMDKLESSKTFVIS